MTAMTLLRAMSDIAPQDIEAALCAEGGHAVDAEAETSPAEAHRGLGSVIGSKAPPADVPNIRLHLGGWAAAAACILLTAGAILHFRQGDNGLVLAPSLPDQIVEVTGTATTTATAASAETTTAYTAATGTQPAQQTETLTVTVFEGDTAPDAEPPAAPQTESPQTTAPTDDDSQPPETTTVHTYAEHVPVLVAMADDAGLLTHSDGSAFADGECTWETVTDAAAIGDYLNGEQPVVTVGGGQKPEHIAEQIMQNPAMLRIRWQITDAKWESYGIQYANLDKNGVLHLHIAMYSSGTPQPEADWVYETALLYESETLPPISEVDLQLIYYDDSDGGIGEWLLYIASLLDDVDIRID